MEHCGKITPLNAQGWERGGVKQLSFLTSFRLNHAPGFLLSSRREVECFAIINRGALWYERLTDEQRGELDEWYQAWMDAPQTSVVPAPLKWIEPQTYDEGGLS